MLSLIEIFFRDFDEIFDGLYKLFLSALQIAGAVMSWNCCVIVICHTWQDGISLSKIIWFFIFGALGVWCGLSSSRRLKKIW